MFTSMMPGHTGPLTELAPEYAALDAMKAWLDAMRPLPPATAKSLRDDMILRYTYHSNAIEGNTLTLMETKVVLEDGLTIGGKSMREHLEAINHREAIAFLEEACRDDDALSERLVKELHQLILKGIDNANAGKYRQQNVLISGAGFNPPDFLHVQEHMEAFIRWRQEESPRLHPVERAARVHADFVNIHPFIDGNGRTARLLMNLELLRAGFPVAIVPVEERSNYYANLDAAAVRGDYAPFARQLCELVAKGFEQYWFAAQD
ncbi:Fic family protein [Desulfovibrio sp. OttesenSCG-928-C14]|nr:Fic family protein [Desulfovibrio sp. OttesenSCG-928-C14]